MALPFDASIPITLENVEKLTFPELILRVEYLNKHMPEPVILPDKITTENIGRLVARVSQVHLQLTEDKAELGIIFHSMKRIVLSSLE